MKKILLSLVMATVLFACKKDDDEVTPDTTTTTEDQKYASLNVMIECEYDGGLFKLDSLYETTSGDSVNVSTLQFFVSNIKLTGDNNLSFMENESYHLVTKGSSMMSMFTVDSIPAGMYHMLHFGLGVDPTANKSLDHATSGDLDPAVSQGMLWSWNTGYKFLKLEGDYVSESNATGSFTYHVGGDDIYKETMLHQMMTVEEEKTYEIHFKLDVKQLFGALDVDQNSSAHMNGGAFMDSLKNNLMLHHFAASGSDMMMGGHH